MNPEYQLFSLLRCILMSSPPNIQKCWLHKPIGDNHTLLLLWLLSVNHLWHCCYAHCANYYLVNIFFLLGLLFHLFSLRLLPAGHPGSSRGARLGGEDGTPRTSRSPSSRPLLSSPLSLHPPRFGHETSCHGHRTG